MMRERPSCKHVICQDQSSVIFQQVTGGSITKLRKSRLISKLYCQTKSFLMFNFIGNRKGNF